MFGGAQIERNVNFNLYNQYLFQLGQYQTTLPNVRKKPVGIFWDIENCQIPRGMSACGLVEQIRALYREMNMIEHEFVVACDVYGINKSSINELNEMQVNIMHCCSFAKNATDEKLKQLIYRFVMIHGQDCAIILISSDINFAPLLSDIKNRIGIVVILFHHRQVSSALLACSHHHIDYDEFCSNIALPNSSRQENFITTHLAIWWGSNWDQNMNEERVKNLLNLITSNTGAREINVDYQKCSAVYLFKCKSDAQRCLQKVNDRRWSGNTLKAQIIIPNQPQQRVSRINPLIPNLPNSTNSYKPNFSLSIAPQPIPQKNSHKKHNMSSVFIKFKANQCERCTSNSTGISRHAFHLFKKEILNVHISIDKLTEKLNHLFELHPGNRLPLNSLPQCWLSAFNEELNTTTEPKVMLEHLLTCLDGISTEYSDVEVEGEKVSTKFLVKLNENCSNPKAQSKDESKLSQLLPQIKMLIMKNMSQSLTSFPSILLSTLESKYEAHFKEPLSCKNYGASNLFELISSLKDNFNLYTYDDDFLVALNFKEQVKCFAHDTIKALTFYCQSENIKLSSETNVDVDLLLKAFKKYFGIDLNISSYGICFIQDLINVIEKKDIQEETDEANSPELSIVDLEANPLFISHITALLQSLPNSSIRMHQFYHDCASFFTTHFGLSFGDYPHFVRSLSTLQPKYFQIISDEDTDWIVLPSKYLRRKLSKRLLQIFDLMALVGDQYSTDCDSMISFTLNDIFAYYLCSCNKTHLHPYSIFRTSSLVKMFERALISMYKSQIDYQCFLIYSKENIFLQRCQPHWIEEKVMALFALLFESHSFSLPWEQLNESFQNIFGFSLGPSAFYHEQFRKVAYVEVGENVSVKIRPLFEFAAKCLSVMLLHSENALKKWNIGDLEREYYQHFGAALPSPQTFDCADFKQLFKRLTLLFCVEDLSDEKGLTIFIKKPTFLNFMNSLSIATCKYCE